MTKHIESQVPRLPVRDADRTPAPPARQERSVVQTTGPLIPVHEIPGLRPEERVAELQLRVRTGFYAQAAVVEQVVRAIHARGT
jgi:hypothetical protein